MEKDVSNSDNEHLGSKIQSDKKKLTFRFNLSL